MDGYSHNISRREFLRRLGLGTGSAVAMMAMEPFHGWAKPNQHSFVKKNTFSFPDYREKSSTFAI